MPASRIITVWIALVPGITLAAPAARAQEAEFQPGVKVFAKSPDFVLRDGATVVPFGSPLDTYRVDRVDVDRVRLSCGGREGDALASELVRTDLSEAFFGDQIRANPHAVHGYLMRTVARLQRHDLPGR